jgi:hypothetical protein
MITTDDHETTETKPVDRAAIAAMTKRELERLAVHSPDWRVRDAARLELSDRNARAA